MWTETISVTTNSSGAGTGTCKATNGVLYAVYWNKGSGASGIDATLTLAGTTYTATLLTLTNADASAWYYPRLASSDNTGAAMTTHFDWPVLVGIPTLTIAQGGDTKTCSMTLFFYPD